MLKQQHSLPILAYQWQPSKWPSTILFEIESRIFDEKMNQKKSFSESKRLWYSNVESIRLLSQCYWRFLIFWWPDRVVLIINWRNKWRTGAVRISMTVIVCASNLQATGVLGYYLLCAFTLLPNWVCCSVTSGSKLAELFCEYKSLWSALQQVLWLTATVVYDLKFRF